MVLSLLDLISNIRFVLCKKNIDRTPSHFISKTQCLSLKGLSIAVDNIGFIFFGNASLTTPFLSFRAATLVIGDLSFLSLSLLLLVFSVFALSSLLFSKS